MSSGTHFEGNKTLTFILAGSEDDHLYPLTAELPKPVVPFGGVFRIIDFTLSNVLNSGLRHVYVLTQHKHERLQSYVREGWPQLSNEFRQDYGEEMICLPPSCGQRYRGTADAVFQNLDLIEKSHAEYVLIVSGDQVYHMDYGKLLDRHVTSHADLTIAAVESPVGLTGSLGVIEADPSGRVIGFEDKPLFPRPMRAKPEKALVNMGVYVFGKKALIETLRENADLNDGDDFNKNILAGLIRSGRAGVFEFSGYWSRVGTLDGYYHTNLDLLLASAPLNPYENAAWPTRSLAGPQSLQCSGWASESRISVDATLTSCEVWMSIVSSGARIDADAELESAIVLPGAHIGKGAKIRNAIVAEKTIVCPQARIGYDTGADRSQFTVSKKGIVIVGASEPRLARKTSRVPGGNRSLEMVRPHRVPRCKK